MRETHPRRGVASGRAFQTMSASKLRASHVHCQQSYEAVASRCAHRDIDRMKPISEGKEEEEDGDVEENGDTVS